MTAARRTVLYLVSEDWYFVTHRLPLARAAIAKGHRVVVATRAGADADRIREAGCEVAPLDLHRAGLNPLRDLAAILRLARLYRAVRPDLVHHVALKPVLYGSLAARLAGRPAVVNALAGLGYVFSDRSPRARVARPIVVALLRLLLGGPRTTVILQNPDDLRLLTDLGALRSRAVLIRGAGVDLEAFRPAEAPPPDPPVVVLSARMLRHKGIEDFARAAKLLRSGGVPARFVLVGGTDSGNPGSVTPEQLSAWQADGQVEWWGHRTDMPEVLRQCAVACLPSFYREGIPKALLEAAACGLPLVASDIPGCREVVRDGVNGLLVPPQDPEGLAAALRGLLADPALRRRMGAESRRLAEAEFGLDRVVSATMDVYAELLA